MTTYERPTSEPLPEELYTSGVSPKLSWPAAGLIALGVVVLIVGFVIDEDIVVYIALGLLGAVGVQIPAAFVAPPGDVRNSRLPGKVFVP
jgi:hypothetical protein